MLPVYVYIPFVIMQVVWIIVFWITVMLGLSSLLAISLDLYVFGDKRWMFWLNSIPIIMLAQLLWSPMVFKRSDFARLARRNGFDLKKQSLLIRLFMKTLSIKDVAVKNKMLMASLIRGSMLHMFYVTRTNEDKNLTAEKMNTTDRVVICARVALASRFNEEIRITKSSRNITKTGIGIIDSAIAEQLESSRDFHGRIVSTGYEVALVVIGGPWLGLRFKKRIQMGIDVMDTIVHELERKRKVEEWDSSMLTDSRVEQLLRL